MLSKTSVLLFVILVASVLSGSVAAADREASWVEVNAPNFCVISDAGEKKAEQVAVQF